MVRHSVRAWLSISSGSRLSSIPSIRQKTTINSGGHVTASSPPGGTSYKIPAAIRRIRFISIYFSRTFLISYWLLKGWIRSNFSLRQSSVLIFRIPSNVCIDATRAPEFQSGGPRFEYLPPKKGLNPLDKMAAKSKESQASAADGSKVCDGAQSDTFLASDPLQPVQLCNTRFNFL